MELTGKDLIAYRTARFFQDGDVVNLGIGMPTKCLDYLPEGVDVWEIAKCTSGSEERPPSYWKISLCGITGATASFTTVRRSPPPDPVR